jgi:outer membrane protein OmpA-like peptidoglycan-associated protein
MKPVARLCSLLALSLFLSPVLFAGDPPASKSKSGKAASAKSEPAAAAKATAEKDATKESAKESAKESKTAEPATPAATAPVVAPAPPVEDDKPLLRPVPATTGGLGLFTLETGETLPRGGVGASIYTNKFAREPGSVSVVQLGLNVSYGIVDWVTAYLGFVPHQHFHVSRPGRLSFNSLVSNPQFGSTIYRSLLPIAGSPPGYVEDYPFVSHNDGDRGEVTLGLKWGLVSERRGAPFNFAVNTDFIIPTRTSLSDLLDAQGQTGQFNFALRAALSKTFGNTFLVTFNWGYRTARDPRFNDVRALNQAEQMSFGTGFLIFPERRFQLMSEYSALVFVGESTQNTSFGARDPFEIISGVRMYPWRNVAVDFGYRNTANLQAHGDRNGFIVKLAGVHWPGAPPKPVNRPPMAACSADKTSVYAGSDEVVGVNARASDPDGDTLSYAWTATGGRVEGAGASVRWNSANTTPGVYTVTTTVTDGMGGSASCSVDIRVEPRPNRAPSLTCSAERSSVLAGERVRIRGEASDPDGDQLTYSWRANAGQIVGSGSSVQLDTSGLAPGRYTVTGRVEDGRGGAADCSTAVAVQEPPAPPQASKLNECFFRASSARVDNVCKRVLDDVALRLQSSPRARIVIVGYADPKEPRPDRLATARAEAARKYLESKGIPAARVDVRTASGQTGADRQNRRIDVIWVPEGATF